MRRFVLGLAAAVTLSAAAGSAEASWLSHWLAPRRPPQPVCVVVTPPPPRGVYVGHHNHAPRPWAYPHAHAPRPQTFQSGYRSYPAPYSGNHAPHSGGVRF